MRTHGRDGPIPVVCDFPASGFNRPVGKYLCPPEFATFSRFSPVLCLVALLCGLDAIGRFPLSYRMNSERVPSGDAFTSSSSTSPSSIFNSALVPPAAAPPTASAEQDNKDNKRSSPQVIILTIGLVSLEPCVCWAAFSSSEQQKNTSRFRA